MSVRRDLEGWTRVTGSDKARTRATKFFTRNLPGLQMHQGHQGGGLCQTKARLLAFTALSFLQSRFSLREAQPSQLPGKGPRLHLFLLVLDAQHPARERVSAEAGQSTRHH